MSRALVADTTEVSQRLRPMARLGGCVGVGFVLGPGLGGVLSKRFGLQFPPMLASALFFLSHAVIAICVPETAPLPLSIAELDAVLALLERRWVEEAAAEAMRKGQAGGIVLAPGGGVVRMLAPDGSNREDGAAAGPAVPRAAEARLPLRRALGLARSLVKQWMPNGKQVEAEANSDAVLNAWTLALTREAGKSHDNSLSFATFRAVAADSYADLKVGLAMLHADSAPALKASAGGGGGGGSSASAAGGLSSSSLIEMTTSVRRLWTSKSLPQVRKLLLARSLVEVAVMVTHATFADYTRGKFGWDQKRTGYGMALSGLISVTVDLVLLPPLHSRRALSELSMGLIGGGLVSFGLLCLALTLSIEGFFAGLGLLSLGASLYKSALASIVMGLARRDEAGTVSGAMDAMEAVCRVAAPIAGGLLLERGVAGLEGPPLLGACLAALGVVSLYEVAPKRARRPSKEA